MFSGINEIMIVAAIVLAIIFIPRMNVHQGRNRPLNTGRVQTGRALSGRQRLAILASILWAAFWAVHYEPWHQDWKLFAYIGAGPVLVTWGAWWALGAGRNSR